MKRSRYSEEQISGIQTGYVTGVNRSDLCRKDGMLKGAFVAWNAMLGGMAASDARWLKALEDENAKLRKLLAGQMLDAAALKELLAKTVRPAVRREAVAHLQAKSRLPHCRCGSEHDPLPINQTAGDGAAPAAACSGE